MNGFVVLDKAAGASSFSATNRIRRLYGEKKAGHTGTLDPMATGVLPVALGRATRLITFLPPCEKGYRARFRLGVSTDTLDITGTVLRERPVAAGEAEVRRALAAFRGELLQTPPMYSAISVNGERLYKLARQGVEVERAARRVTVYRLELTEALPGHEYEIDVLCSKGTYIRSLIADLGESLGCGAVMTALRRTASDGFTLDRAVTEAACAEAPGRFLLPPDTPFFGDPAAAVTERQAFRFCNGGELTADRVKGVSAPGRYRVYDPQGRFLGLGECGGASPETLRVLKTLGLPEDEARG